MARRYVSAKRAAGAEATRRSILAAAAGLFGEHGYADTTMAGIAAAAGVGPNTVYTGFGSKSALVVALVEQVRDDPSVEAASARLRTTPDASAVLAVVVHDTRRFLESHLDVLTVAMDSGPADAAIADAYTAEVIRFRGHLDDAARRIVLLRGGSRPGDDRAGDILWFHLGLPAWRVLLGCGWTWQECEDFLLAQLRSLLLPDT